MKKLLNNKWATVCCLPYGKLLLLVTDNVLDHDYWNNIYDSSMFNNWLSNNSEENKQLCAYPFSSPSDLENGADDIMNQAHAFVAVFEQDSGRSTNTRVPFSCFRVAAFRKWLWIGRSQEKTIK